MMNNNDNSRTIPIVPNQFHLLTILSLSINQESVKNVLSTQEIECVRKIIYRDQELVESISKRINEIMKDGKVEVHEIPDIIWILVDLYQLYIIQNSVKEVSVEKIIKFCLNSMMQYNYISFGDIDKSIINNIINTSMKLLQTNMELCKKNSVWNRFYQFLFVKKGI